MTDCMSESIITAYEKLRVIHTPMVVALLIAAGASFFTTVPSAVYVVFLVFFSIELIGNMLKQREGREW